MRALFAATVVLAVALPGAMPGPAPAAAGPTVFVVAGQERPKVRGAALNLEACTRYGTNWRTSCADEAENLEYRAVSAVRRISTARLAPNAPCAAVFAGLEAAAWTAAGRAGANYRRPRLRATRLAQYRRLEAAALVRRNLCYRGAR